MCDRRPEVCRTGKDAIETIGVRAREGARIAIGMIGEDDGGPDGATATGGGATSNRPSTGRFASEGASLVCVAAQADNGNSIEAKKRARFIAPPDMGASPAQQVPNRLHPRPIGAGLALSAKSAGFGG